MCVQMHVYICLLMFKVISESIQVLKSGFPLEKEMNAGDQRVVNFISLHKLSFPNFYYVCKQLPHKLLVISKCGYYFTGF